LATRAGARALGRDHDTGTITPGKVANLTAIALPDRAANDPYEALLAGNGSVVETWYQGRPLGDRLQADQFVFTIGSC
jgi:cytosine/adenosine deaminase-related metal-dependent hydrolase